MKVAVEGLKPLCFATTLEFGGGEEISVSLQYERLFGFCKLCHSLCHAAEHCPQAVEGGNGDNPEVPPDGGVGGKFLSYKAASSQGWKKPYPSEGVNGKGKRGIPLNEGKRQVQASGIGALRGKNERLKGDSSSGARRFTSYAQFHNHRMIHEGRRGQSAEERGVSDGVSPHIDGNEKPQKKVRKALLFEDGPEQQLETIATTHGDSGGSPRAELVQETVVSDAGHVNAVTEVVEPVMETAVDRAPEGSLSEVIEGETDELHNLSLDEGKVGDSGEAAGGLVEVDVIETMDTEGLIEGEVGENMDTGFCSSGEQLGGMDLSNEVQVSEEHEEAGVEEVILESALVTGKGKGHALVVGKKKGIKPCLVLKGVSSRKRNVQALASPRGRKGSKIAGRVEVDLNSADPIVDKGLPGGSKAPKPAV